MRQIDVPALYVLASKSSLNLSLIGFKSGSSGILENGYNATHWSKLTQWVPSLSKLEEKSWRSLLVITLNVVVLELELALEVRLVGEFTNVEVDLGLALNTYNGSRVVEEDKRESSTEPAWNWLDSILACSSLIEHLGLVPDNLAFSLSSNIDIWADNFFPASKLPIPIPQERVTNLFCKEKRRKNNSNYRLPQDYKKGKEWLLSKS